MRYFFLIFKHKWFVFLAGRKFGVSYWRLFKHDWTKFLPAELPHYQRQFFGKKDHPAGFIRAWVHHQNSNDHHWEYWIPRTGHNRCTPPYPDNVPIQMSEQAVLEMLADWVGASRAYEGKWPTATTWTWQEQNLEKVLFRVQQLTARKILYELNWHKMITYERYVTLLEKIISNVKPLPT